MKHLTLVLVVGFLTICFSLNANAQTTKPAPKEVAKSIIRFSTPTTNLKEGNTSNSKKKKVNKVQERKTTAGRKVQPKKETPRKD